LSLILDRPGALLLGGAALLWSLAGAYASAAMAKDGRIREFSVWWLLTQAGTFGVFVVADIASFYLMFTLASLAAYGLIVHDETPRARRAAAVYVALAVLGEACLLLAFVMLANDSPAANPSIRDAVDGLASSRFYAPIAALVLIGFALKMGLVPLHVWLPLAHPAAPAAASAVLSGILVAVGVMGLIRFLPFDTELPGAGLTLAAAGLVTAFYGVAVGVAQARPKVVLAYSTVSQMGLVAAIVGMGLLQANPETPTLAAYYTLHHALVKGGLFLAVGLAASTGVGRRRPLLIVTALLALSLCGLPFTSGALAKLAAKPMLGDGLAEVAFTIAAAGSTLLMIHFIGVLRRDVAPVDDARPGAATLVPWLALSALSLLGPWALYPILTGSDLASTMSLKAIWGLAWPIAAGAIAALALHRVRGRIPHVPEGDVLVVANAARPLLRRAGRLFDDVELRLSRWSVAAALLALAVVVLGGKMLGAAF